MAGDIFVSDINEGDHVDGLFMVDNCSIRSTKDKRAYLKLHLSDMSGSIEAVAWDEAIEKNPDAKKVMSGSYISLKGKSSMNRYTNKVEISISVLKVIEDADVDPAHFLPSTGKDIVELKKDLRELINKVSDDDYSRLLGTLFDDDRFYEQFTTAPAAKNYHHAYLGGLLEHSVSVASLAILLSSFYGDVDVSLLVTGAILHDVGKIREFDYSKRIDYSTEGRLKGHIVIGNEIVDKAMDALADFPEKKRNLLSHLILSHQGELEFGAAVRPKTKEAVILSIIDNVDAKINGFMEIAKKYPKDIEWTDYQSMFQDFLYLGPKSSQEEAKQLKFGDEDI